MFATVFYWVIIAVLAAWGIWSAVWSVIYVADGQNGNLGFYAIINAIVLLLAGLVFLIYTNADWQWFWFVSKQLDISLYAIILVAYLVMVILQFILGFAKKSQKA